MKLSITIAAIMICGLAYSQEFPRDLKLAVKESGVVVQDSLTVNPNLSYYSKNYDKVFRQEYDSEVLNYAVSALFMDNYRSVWYDSTTPHIFRVMPLPGVNVDAFNAIPCNSGFPNQQK